MSAIMVESGEDHRFEEKEEESSSRPAAVWPEVGKKRLSKQMSVKDTTRERVWMRRQRQIMKRRMEAEAEEAAGAGGKPPPSRRERRLSSSSSLTDEDLTELKGVMDLGFRFTESDECEELCNTLPALNLYFAVKRQYSDSKLQYSPSPATTPSTTGGSQVSSTSSSPLPSPTPPTTPNQSISADSWKIVEPGDKPQHVKTKLRHWAQAVACSVKYQQNSG